MATRNAQDEFANYAIVKVTESAANTLTFKKLETGISLNEKVAWVINRLEYFSDSLTGAQMGAEGDSIQFGLSVSNAFAAPSMEEVTVIDYNVVSLFAFSAAGYHLNHLPFVKDLSNLPGGGILVPPVPLYLFAKGNSLAAASTEYVRIHYTLLTLAIEQYWQLVEARRVLSS